MIAETLALFLIASVPPPRAGYHEQGSVTMVKWLFSLAKQDPEKGWVAIYGPSNGLAPSLRDSGASHAVVMDGLPTEKGGVVASPYRLPLKPETVKLFMYMAYAPKELFAANRLLQELVAPIENAGFLMFFDTKATQFPRLLEHMPFERLPFVYKGMAIYQKRVWESA